MRNNVLKTWCAEFAGSLIHRTLLAEDDVRLPSSPDPL